MALNKWQAALNAAGYPCGAADGLWGPRTEAASFRALANAKPVRGGAVPLAWMPEAVMSRVHVHWTAGTYLANSTDRQHYHILIEADGLLIRGVPSIDLNQSPLRDGYAAHTLNANGGAIGVTACAMRGAVEKPFNAGDYPMTQAQWDKMVVVVADLCWRYDIPVTPRTVLSHAEVQGTLGIKQRGKWDIAALPFDPTFPKTAPAVGGRLRAAVRAEMTKTA